jgi:hypothetical protein
VGGPDPALLGLFARNMRCIVTVRQPPHAACRFPVERGGDELAEQMADAEAPFWEHVREALSAQQELPASIDEDG